ncbi:MAG: DUF362 domain-containing protein [Armatimonadota bacterium]
MGTGRQRRVDRRQFVREGSAAAAALLVGGGLLQAAPAGPSVVTVRDKTRKSIDGFQVNADIARRLVDRAVMTLAGKDDIAKAWATYVGPNDRVAIKFNGLFPWASTHAEIIHAVTGGLLKAGVDPARIVVCDRDDKDAITAGLTVSRERDGIGVYGIRDRCNQSVNAGPVRTSLADILTEADVLINLPIMKSHNRAGVTGALKNHLGSIPNARDFHENFCASIADLNALGPIKDKTRICICDALYGGYHGGPPYVPECRWDYHGVIASVDPVALDAVLDDIVMAKRLEEGMSPRFKPIDHITRAAELGLGEADLANINRISREV